jgi:5'-nucleotidase/UDP-sugar diphosphatase
MNRLFLLLVVPAIALTGLARVVAQTDTVTIIHVNDSHSALAPIGPRTASLDGRHGGIARVATIVGTLQATNPNPLFLHAGDFSIGDIFYNAYFGVPELQILLGLGCKAMAVGNHEFDLTPSTLQTALDSGFAAGSFPLLSANLILDDPAVQSLKKYIQPYTIETEGATKVGIFGMLLPETMVISNPAPAVVDMNLGPIAMAMVDTLKAQGCGVVILLSHLGVYYDQMLASAIPGINVIIGGHDHYAFPQPLPVVNPLGDTTWIAQANAFYLNVGKLRLAASPSGVHLLDYELIAVDSTTSKEPTIDAVVQGLQADIEGKYGPVFTQQIGTATGFFEEVADSLMMNGPQDTPIGNLVTDAFRALTHTDIAIEAGGSTAMPIYPGPLVAVDAFRVVGYGFNMDNGLGYQLVTFAMTGADLMFGLEFGLSTIELNDEYLLQTSGLEYTYNPGAPAYSRVASVTIGGLPLIPSATYSVTANAFTKVFLEYLQVPFTNLHEFRGDTTEFQVLTDYIKAHSPISPVSGGRIVSPVNEKEGSLPQKFFLAQNYPNPFNPATEIRYGIQGTVHVTLKVFDIVGREVVTLVNEQKPAGEYSVRFDATGLASGVYFYRLEAGSLLQTKKLIVLR